MEEILRYRGGTVSAGGRIITQDISFSVFSGSTLALIGETGSGKTMTALSIMGLLPADVRQSGHSILLSGRKRKNPLGREIAYIPQNGLEYLNPAMKVGAHLLDSLKRLGTPRSCRRPVALDALRKAGFDQPQQIMDRYPFQLSGGMAQRVTIALCILCQARLIIADEPTNGLDEGGKQTFISTLNDLFPQSGKLVITHDISLAALCDQVLVLQKGRMMEQGSSAALLRDPRHPYTRALMAALVENGMQSSLPLRQQKGDCPFYERCPAASPACRRVCREEAGRRWWCDAGM